MDENTSRSEDDTGEEPEDSASSTAVANLSSSSRQMRNQAEKLRRDKLNQFINELAALVPMVSSSAKRLDKTSILRLSAAFLRIHQIIVNGRDIGKSMPVVPGNMNWCQCVLEGMEGILLIVTAPGKIVFVSHNIESSLGHQQIELLGQSLFNITNLEDHDELKKNLKPDTDEEEECTGEDSGTSSRGEGSSERRRPQRRSFYIRLRHRSVSRSEQPQYEMYHIVGQLRVPPPPSPKNHKTDAQLSNDIVLVALLKPVREKCVSEYSLLEASKEEWTTRHLMDSRIIFTDHRISINSGYMSEEVTGKYALQYMHRDDVRWVMIALRQMFYSEESFGSSCYRLLSKNGEFIYVRTHGYLELSSDPNDLQSFICINTLVTKEEGEKLIGEMKKNYSSLMNHKVEPAIMAIADKRIRTKEKEVGSTDDVEDPSELTAAIQHLIDALPEMTAGTSRETKEGLREKFAKYKAAYKNMPPTPSIGVDFPVPALRRNSAGKFDRPSVLRVTQSNSNTVSVFEPASQPQDKQKRTTTEEVETVLKRPRPDGVCSVIVTERERDWPSVIRQRQDYAPQLPPEETDPANPTTSVVHSPIDSDILDPRSEDYFSQCLTLPNLDDIDQDEISHLYVQDKDIWETENGKLEQELVRGQMELKGNIQYQERQISAIKNDLTLVPMDAVGGHKYRNTFTHLKAEHKKQQQMLRTLQQDHQNMQNCKDHLTMRGVHQDIGV